MSIKPLATKVEPHTFLRESLRSPQNTIHYAEAHESSKTLLRYAGIRDAASVSGCTIWRVVQQ